MRSSLEELAERVRKLEAFRYRVIGRFNACQTMLFDVWTEHLKHHSADPEAVAAEFRKKWLKHAKTFAAPAVGADPAALDLIQAEHEKAIDELSARLVLLARQSKKSDPERSP